MSVHRLQTYDLLRKRFPTRVKTAQRKSRRAISKHARIYVDELLEVKSVDANSAIGII